jgi:diaminopimelate epimerase
MSKNIRFSKMHGIGNDFVIIDQRNNRSDLTPALVTAMANRHTGIGFDQLLTIEPPRHTECVATYRIYNADGSEAAQCGNGVRCIVSWLSRDGSAHNEKLKLDGPSGIIECHRLAGGRVRANMGIPVFDPQLVPFIAESDATSHTLEGDGITWNLGVVSMGNPHAVLTVPDVEQAPVNEWGRQIERHMRFPKRVNVGFAQRIDAHALRLRVFERGVGETRACGSGACAAVAVLTRSKQLISPVTVALPGGGLVIEWAGEGTPLWMTGPTAFVFDGVWPCE